MRSPWVKTVCLLLVFSSVNCITARADLPTALEPKYSEAVLALSSKEYDRAAALIQDCLAQYPQLPDFLEIQALAYKGAQRDQQAQEVYLKLLNVKKNSPPVERAPYLFELGSLHFKTKDFSKANSEFTAALASGFNPGADHFFLGIIAYRQKRWGAAAQHLESFRGQLVADLRPAAALYLAQAYSESGYGLGASQNYYDARQAANDRISDPSSSLEAQASSKSVLKAAEQELLPVARKRLFSDVGFMVGYDTNVLSLPSGVPNSSSQATGKKSAEGTLIADLGYMTSALNELQYVPSYRLRFNYGANAAAAPGNFAANTLSLYVNHEALDRFSYGAKVEGNLIFQDSVDPMTNASTFRAFILSGAIGPYLKWQFNPYWMIQAEIAFILQKFYADADNANAPTLFQSGQDYHAKLGVKKTGLRYFNPGFSLSNDLNRAAGTQFRSETLDLGLSNDLKFSDRLILTLGADLGIPWYFSASPARTDRSVSAYSSLTWGVFRKLTLLASFSYAANTSNSADNVSAYAFNRATVSTGASWALF